MEAELSEMTIEALLYRESCILQMGKFLKRKTWYSVPQWTTRETPLIPVWLRFLRHNLRAAFDAAPVRKLFFSLFSRISGKAIFVRSPNLFCSLKSDCVFAEFPALYGGVWIDFQNYGKHPENSQRRQEYHQNFVVHHAAHKAWSFGDGVYHHKIGRYCPQCKYERRKQSQVEKTQCIYQFPGLGFYMVAKIAQIRERSHEYYVRKYQRKRRRNFICMQKCVFDCLGKLGEFRGKPFQIV